MTSDRKKFETLKVEEAGLLLERNIAQSDYDTAPSGSVEASRRYHRLSDIIRSLSKAREQIARLKLTINIR